jgi:hypothetical protein
MAKIGVPEVLSLIAYVAELVIVFFPEIQTYVLALTAAERIVLFFSMVLLPAMPFVIGRRQAVYSILCKLFRVSKDERKLLVIIWSKPSLSENEISRIAGMDLTKVHYLVNRLENRGLVDREKPSEGADE